MGAGVCKNCVSKVAAKGGAQYVAGAAVTQGIVTAHMAAMGAATVSQQVALQGGRRASVNLSANAGVRFTGGAMAANSGVAVSTFAGPATLSAAACGFAGKQIVQKLGGGEAAQEGGQFAGSVGGGAAAGAVVAGPIGAAGGAALGAVSYGVSKAVDHPGEIASAIGTSMPALSTSGTCQVLPQYWVNCSRKIQKCPDCNYTYCSYHFKKGRYLFCGRTHVYR